MSDSHGVSRLKELLFDSESQALADLSRRIDRLTEINTDERRALRESIDGLFDRVGTPERMEYSVATILDGAIRRAEVDRHKELADAFSPLVVRTVRTEIRNSRDELVEALYPMTGRMVKAYVASAMKDLMQEVNRRIEQNPFMLRMASIVTGRSPAELALAGAQRTEVEELYLIRRGSGELIARWPESAGTANRDHVVSGVLSALNEFASEAFKDDGRSLRQIDIGPSQVYLRLSPLNLMAVRLKGSRHAAVEQIIDEEFLSGLEKHAAAAADATSAAQQSAADNALLATIAQSLATRVATAEEQLAPPRFGALLLKTLAWLIGLPLVAWFAWSTYTSYETENVRRIAQTVISSHEELRGYPTHIAVEHRGRALTITGLAPLASAKEKVVADLRSALPGRNVRDQMAVVPSGLANAEPLIRAMRDELGQSIDRTRAESSELVAAEQQTRGHALDLERQARDTEIAALKAKIAALEARPMPAPAEEGPRELLQAWSRAHAIFFGNGTDYRDPERTAQLLDELAALMKTNDAVVRVVGYTDGIGAAERNSTLSQNRAETVLQELVTRGVEPSRLVAIGRSRVLDIAPTSGTQSPNRRVEFEVGFVGELLP